MTVFCSIYIYTYTHTQIYTWLKTLALLTTKRPFCTTEAENKQEDIVVRQN